jgi:hypothetical protein
MLNLQDEDEAVYFLVKLICYFPFLSTRRRYKALDRTFHKNKISDITNELSTRISFHYGTQESRAFQQII